MDLKMSKVHIQNHHLLPMLQKYELLPSQKRQKKECFCVIFMSIDNSYKSDITDTKVVSKLYTS